VKLDSSGALQWQKCLGGSGEDGASSIKQTSDGGYIAAGFSQSNDGDVSGNHGSYDDWIVKLNNSGTIQWQNSIGGSGDDGANSIQPTSDSGYIVAGYSTSNDGDVSGNHGSYDRWLVKLDSTGGIQWQRSLGGSDVENAQSVEQTSDGGYIAAGHSNSNDGDVTGNHGAEEYWISKLNSSGNFQWQKCFGGSNNDVANSIKETSDHGYIIGGYSNSDDGDVSGNQGSYDSWIVKLNPDALLPVTLVDFSGEVNGKQNLLHWTTATEQNNRGFEIQCSSDAVNFSKIGFINSKGINGNSNAKLHYDFTDIHYSFPVNYYRLKQTDNDGRFSYSNIVLLKDPDVITAGLIDVYPNPVKNILNVNIASQNNTKITLVVIDINGKSLIKKGAYAGNGQSILEVDVSGLSAGSYYLTMTCPDGCKNTVMKFQKE
jgi:hypothetical protein